MVVIIFHSCQVLATDLNGKKVFLPRYIREQNLPPDFGFDPANPPPNAMVSLLGFETSTMHVFISPTVLIVMLLINNFVS